MKPTEIVIAPISAAALRQIDPLLTFPTVAEAGRGGDYLLGMGGLSWKFGRCWLWYRVVDRAEHTEGSSHPHLIVRAARRMLRRARQLGETAVYAWRDDSEPSSKRLLQVIGFDFLGFEDVETIDNRIERKEVWRYTWPTPSP